MRGPLRLPPGGPPRRQRGIVLAVALIMLVVITLLGVSAMQVTSLEERMAGNMRDRSLAFQSAEAALRDGERLLAENTVPAFDGNNGLYQAPAPDDPPVWLNADDAFWETNGRTYSDTVSGVSAPPRYIIEEFPYVPAVGDSLDPGEIPPPPNTYRVTARGIGGSATAVVVLQSTYRRNP